MKLLNNVCVCNVNLFPVCNLMRRFLKMFFPPVQYRMHPEICRFPSMHFYENKLLNGAQMVSKSAPFHEHCLLGPYMFFDIVDGHECYGKNAGFQSLFNECEADAAVEILKFLKKRSVCCFSHID